MTADDIKEIRRLLDRVQMRLDRIERTTKPPKSDPALREIVDELDRGEGIHKRRIIGEFIGREIADDEREAHELLMGLRQRGEVYEPRQDVYRVT